MPEDLKTVLTLAPEELPESLRIWLDRLGSRATLASMEVLDDGTLVVQALPEIDPRFVARIRRLMGQHADVLRRLT